MWLRNPRNILTACGSQSSFLSSVSHTGRIVRAAIRCFWVRGLTGIAVEVFMRGPSLVTLSGPHSFSFGRAALLRLGHVPVRVAAASMERILREWTTTVKRRRIHPGRVQEYRSHGWRFGRIRNARYIRGKCVSLRRKQKGDLISSGKFLKTSLRVLTNTWKFFMVSLIRKVLVLFLRNIVELAVVLPKAAYRSDVSA